MKNKSNTESPLDQANKQDMFGVPESYFRDLPGRILETVEIEIPDEVKSVRAWDRFKPVLLIAASVLGFIMITYTGQKLLRAEKESNLFSSLDVIEYIDYYSHEFGEELLLDNINMDVLESDLVKNETDEIIEYLIQEGIEELTIYNEL